MQTFLKHFVKYVHLVIWTKSTSTECISTLDISFAWPNVLLISFLDFIPGVKQTLTAGKLPFQLSTPINRMTKRERSREMERERERERKRERREEKRENLPNVRFAKFQSKLY
jgi:hypothetical protein